jgi:hypothetical protein
MRVQVIDDQRGQAVKDIELVDPNGTVPILSGHDRQRVDQAWFPPLGSDALVVLCNRCPRPPSETRKLAVSSAFSYGRTWDRTGWIRSRLVVSIRHCFSKAG